MLCSHVTILEGNPICSKDKDIFCSSKKKNTMHVLLIAVIALAVLVLGARSAARHTGRPRQLGEASAGSRRGRAGRDQQGASKEVGDGAQAGGCGCGAGCAWSAHGNDKARASGTARARAASAAGGERRWSGGVARLRQGGPAASNG